MQASYTKALKLVDNHDVITLIFFLKYILMNLGKPVN